MTTTQAALPRRGVRQHSMLRAQAGSHRRSDGLPTDLRWAFSRPWGWLSGLGFNLVLALLYLVIAPLAGRPHHDWAILVGSYFAVYILGDVTTTNVLGSDAEQVRRRLMAGTPLARILIAKNLVLLVVVGLPTLVATAVITVFTESTSDLLVTVPGVLLPILTWLGVGNLISVAFPVAAMPLRERWERRREPRSTVRWLSAFAIPYALYWGVRPLGHVPVALIAALGPVLGHSIEMRGGVLLVLGLTCYGIGTAAALRVARARPIHHGLVR